MGVYSTGDHVWFLSGLHPARLRGGQGSLGSTRSRLLSGHTGGATRGGDRSGQGHETRGCVGHPPARRSPLIVTENGSYAVVRLSSYTLEYEADGLGKTWFKVRDAATIRHLRDDVNGLKA